MDILAELFSSEALIKIMRLFLLNPDDIFEQSEVSERSKVPARKIRYEMNILKKIGFIVQGKKEIEIHFKTKKRPKKKKIKGWMLNAQFPFLRPLKGLLLNAAPIPRNELLRRLRKTGPVKLIVLTGFFLDGEDGSSSGRVDILMVGDGLKKKKVDQIMRFVESKVGKELNYAVLSSKEFQYRMGMYDKFIRDIFDYPHEKLLDKFDL